MSCVVKKNIDLNVSTKQCEVGDVEYFTGKPFRSKQWFNILENRFDL